VLDKRFTLYDFKKAHEERKVRAVGQKRVHEERETIDVSEGAIYLIYKPTQKRLPVPIPDKKPKYREC
jgi:hypothetical protein